MKAWLQMHVKTHADERRKPALDVFCDDCTLEYREQMTREGRCIRA